MQTSIGKSFFGINVPVWKQGQSKQRTLQRGTYKLTFIDVTMSEYLLSFIKERLPFSTSLNYDNGNHTLNVQRVDYNSRTKILTVFVYVTSPPLAIILGGIGLLGVGAYTLYRVERIFTLPIWSIGAAAFITYVLARK